MSDGKQTPQLKVPQPRIENLELNRETLQDLSEGEQEGVKGGEMAITACRKCGIHAPEG